MSVNYILFLLSKVHSVFQITWKRKFLFSDYYYYCFLSKLFALYYALACLVFLLFSVPTGFHSHTHTHTQSLLMLGSLLGLLTLSFSHQQRLLFPISPCLLCPEPTYLVTSHCFTDETMHFLPLMVFLYPQESQQYSGS